MLIELAEAYVKALNGGKVPTIENAWNYVQASELERAFKEVMAEYDSKIKNQYEKQWPLSETDLTQHIAKLKSEVFVSFKSKIMGDINSAKGVEYSEKIKKDFKAKVELLKKKNS
jgi:Guanylate-binding protein, C-terminal domain